MRKYQIHLKLSDSKLKDVEIIDLDDSQPMLHYFKLLKERGKPVAIIDYDYGWMKLFDMETKMSLNIVYTTLDKAPVHTDRYELVNLTDIEIAIIQLLPQKKTRNQIAIELGYKNHKSIGRHIRSMYLKTRTANRQELLTYCRKEGIL